MSRRTAKKKIIRLGVQPNLAEPPRQALAEPDVARVRALQRQIAEGKMQLATMTLQFDSAKGRLVQGLAELEQRAVQLVNDEALSRGLDPAKTNFDWDSLAYSAKVTP